MVPSWLLSLPCFEFSWTGVHQASKFGIFQECKREIACSLDCIFSRSLPDQWWILTSLKHLDLGFNEITSISDHFSGLFSLEVLRMPRNKIAVIPETLVKLRMPSDPPPFDQQASEQEKSQVYRCTQPFSPPPLIFPQTLHKPIAP
jgi:hypothetical protein